MPKKLIGLLACFLILASTTVYAQDEPTEHETPPQIAVSDAYIRVVDVNEQGWIGWIALVNLSAQAVRVLAVDEVEVAPIDLPPNAPTSALIALPNVIDVTTGDAIPVTLTLADAHDRTFDLRVAVPVVDDAPETARLAIVDAWARPMSLSGVSGAYMQLVNLGETDIVIVSAETRTAGMVDLHQTLMEGSMMRMNMIPTVIIPAGQTATFEPGASHIMLDDLALELIDGGALALTLIFDDRTTQIIGVPIYDRALEAIEHTH
ncbi:MAG: copper chaperone PCu(A)C [Chloroflexota bacterium]|nr:copper chaperone PCu(A)C [Chloroflexota bacterium]